MSFTQIFKDGLMRNRQYLFVILLCSLFFLLDLGNLNAIRQGTEGFYLQISKEMFLASSWLTPLYKGAAHWSKPPLHFWLAEISYSIFGMSLFAARLTTALTAIFGLLFFTHWIHRYFNFSKSLIFLGLAASLGIYKYARIYMMEMPLTIFSVLAVLKYYDFLNLARRRDMFLAVTFLALATLVKGPVSMVMAIGGCTLFTLYLYFWHRGERPKNLLLGLIFFTFASGFIASLWFIACYQTYGMEFINYFFLRENLGKFTAQTYPISVLFKGLALYAFPIVLLLPFSISYTIKHFNQLISRHPSRLQISILFLAINFIPFFFLWFIPSQRSHHYAIPSLPLALLIIMGTTGLYFQSMAKPFVSNLYSRLLNFVGALLLIAITFVLGGIIFLFSQSGEIISPVLYVCVAIFALQTIYFCFAKSLTYKMLSYFVVFALSWSIVVPTLSLPDISPHAVELCQDRTVAVGLRKFFFISEALGQEVKPIESSEIINSLKSGSYVITEVGQIPPTIEEFGQVLTSWQVWKRRLHFSTILELYQQAGIVGLQDTRVLLAPRK